MGDRANIIVKEGSEQVVLYTHWRGESLPGILQAALRRGERRWNDFQYLTRIIFSEMIQRDVLEETGYGITTKVWDGEDKIITVDVDNQTVIDYNNSKYSFEEYSQLNLEDDA